MKPGVNKFFLLSEATLCSLGLIAFSYFIHYKFPVRLFSFAALLLSAYIISRNLRSLTVLRKSFGESTTEIFTLIYLVTGAVTGLSLSLFYRWHLDISLFPKSIHSFAITAALIGCMEEVVFRGYLQESVRSINGPFSIFFSTLSHTVYKCCLFLSPVIETDIDVGFLALWTFGAGIIFGTIRHLSKSLLPSLSAHVIFDILVYAEFVDAPWWVW